MSVRQFKKQADYSIDVSRTRQKMQASEECEIVSSIGRQQGEQNDKYLQH